MKTEILAQESSRAEAFSLWMSSPMPMVTLVKTLNVSHLLKMRKKSGIKFTSLMCWCIGRAASNIEEFYLLPENGKLFRILPVRFRNQNTFLSDAELFLGQKELIVQNSAFPLLLEEEIRRLRKKLKGLCASRPDNPEVSFYTLILSEMEDFS